MSLREIKIEAPVFDQTAKTIQIRFEEKKTLAVSREWESITCKLVTPMYGGGVKSAEPDIGQPIRVSAIRGQLRFWWRILAKHQFEKTKKLFDKEFRQAEFSLWGGMADGDENGKASAVFLRVKSFREVSRVSYRDYSLDYVLFPARSLNDEKCLLKEGLTWELQWYVDKDADAFFEIEKDENGKKIRKFSQEKYDTALSQVKETLRWWATFGGVGARTRRGCGAFVVEKSSLPEIEKPFSQDEIQAANCKLALAKSNSNNAISTWKLAVQRLRDFRQGVGVGRNEPSDEARAARKPAGRSRWTEPDAIRRITKTYPAKHNPVHAGGNQFPRGMFGMPIIFHFVGAGEPQDTSLQPIGKERMSSPLIIRPILQNGQWQAAALLLPHDFSKIDVELKNVQKVTLWDSTKANEIKPIKGNGGKDPLNAFLSYFVNPMTQD